MTEWRYAFADQSWSSSPFFKLTRLEPLLKRGLQQEGDFENRWPALLGTLLDTQSS